MPAGVRKQGMLPCYGRTFTPKVLEDNYAWYLMPSGKTMEPLAKRI
jgi:hypothetical protein